MNSPNSRKPRFANRLANRPFFGLVCRGDSGHHRSEIYGTQLADAGRRKSVPNKHTCRPRQQIITKKVPSECPCVTSANRPLPLVAHVCWYPPVALHVLRYTCRNRFPQNSGVFQVQQRYRATCPHEKPLSHLSAFNCQECRTSTFL